MQVPVALANLTLTAPDGKRSHERTWRALLQGKFVPPSVISRQLTCALAVMSMLASCQRAPATPLAEAIRSTRIDTFLDLSGLLPSGSRICVIYPYQDRVAKTNPDHIRINGFLQTSGLTFGEGQRHLLVVGADKITAETHARLRSLDILATHETTSIRNLFPANSQPANRAAARNAKLYKPIVRERVYVVLGQT